MKRINTLLKNENVMAVLVVGGVFLLTALVTLYAMSIN
jgi:hypothetical protein